MPLLVLELIGVAILVVIAWTRRPVIGGLPGTLVIGGALLLLMPLVQLLPVPFSVWAALPGHDAFAQALQIVGEAPGWRTVSLHSAATQYSWLALVPCAAAFLVVRQADVATMRRLAIVLVAVGCAEAILGVMQAGMPAGSAINFGNPYGGGAATGTYINKNHFAGMIAMVLPMLLALWAIEMLPVVTRRGEVLREHPRNADIKFAMRALFSAAAVLLLLALMLSRSRAGIAVGLVAFGLAVVALVWRVATSQVRMVLALLVSGAMLLAAYIGLTPAMERFAPNDLWVQSGTRVELAAATLRAAFDFLPFGSGLGTFADVFRRYQGGSVAGFADHAHNDYAELILELGVAGIAIVALLGVAYAMRWPVVLRQRASRRLRFMQVAAGLGMLAMIVHGIFDFNFHIPANAIFFSLLAGIFFFTPAEDRA